MYRGLKRPGDARALLNQLLASALENWGEAHPYTAELRTKLEILELEEGQYDAAASLLRAAKDVIDARAGNSPLAAGVTGALAQLH